MAYLTSFNSFNFVQNQALQIIKLQNQLERRPPKKNGRHPQQKNMEDYLKNKKRKTTSTKNENERRLQFCFEELE